MPQADYPESDYTYSSVPSTVWGPGTLAGRAIMALGEATLKGLERIIDWESLAIQRRLKRTRRVAPRLSKEMYSDLVELSRPELYSQRVLDEAVKILYYQLKLEYHAAGEIALEISYLPFCEAQLVVLQFHKIYENNAPQNAHVVADGLNLKPQPIFDVITMLLQLQPQFAPVCFEVLDYWLPRPNFAFHHLHSLNEPIVRMHDEDRLDIPRTCRATLSELQLRSNRMSRWRYWERLEGAGYCAQNRLARLESTLLDVVSRTSYRTVEFCDAAVDLLDLIRYSAIPEVRRGATDLLARCLSITRNSWQPLRTILDFSSRSKIHAGWPKYLSPSLAFHLGYGPCMSGLYADAPPTPALYVGPDSFHPDLCEFLRYAYAWMPTTRENVDNSQLTELHSFLLPRSENECGGDVLGWESDSDSDSSVVHVHGTCLIESFY
ncbi:hypothetical protein C8R43DRAFT_1132490 [Mycena crocata]|nr:hypothetical protein C8R43DRAFT_1132490 [Mycena crocata]